MTSKNVTWTASYVSNTQTQTTTASTAFTYYGNGEVKTETDPQTTDTYVNGETHQKETSFTYDADGNPVSQLVQDLGTGADASRTTIWAYNAYDQVQSVTDPAGNVTQYTYYPNGLKETTTDPEQNTTEYQYDQDGNLTATILENYDGSAADDSTAGLLTEESRAYDPAGRLASITNAEGVTTAYTYFDNGLQATVATENLQIAKSSPQYVAPLVTEADTYDSAGNLTAKSTNGGTDTTTYAYDDDNRLVTTTVDPGGAALTTTAVGYYPDGTLATSVATAQGVSRQHTYTYDAGGNMLTDKLSGDGQTRVTSYERDTAGDVTGQTDPDGNTTSYFYDALGRVIMTQYPNEGSETFTPSTLSVTLASVTPETATDYDTFGEKAAIQDADGNVTSNYYDPDGHVREVESSPYTPYSTSGTSTPVQEIKTLTYWPNGKEHTVTDQDGQTTTYAYDQFGNQISVQDPVNGAAHPTTLVYNKAGQPASKTTPAGTQPRSTDEQCDAVFRGLVLMTQDAF